MRNVEPVIEEGGSVEDVHHLRLVALLHDLVRKKGNRGAASVLGIDPRTVASCTKTGRLSWRVREALERGGGGGVQSRAGSAAVRQRKRNDALEGRIEELEEKTRSRHRGSVRPASRRCRRRCCASGSALATRPQKSVEWF